MYLEFGDSAIRAVLYSIPLAIGMQVPLVGVSPGIAMRLGGVRHCSDELNTVTMN